MPTETPPPQPEPESTGQRVAKNAVIYLLSQLASWVVTFASVSAIPRLLGKQALGQLAIADTVVTTVVTFGCLSIEQYLIVEIGRNRNETERLLRATLGLRIALLPLLCLSILAGLWVMGASPTVWVIGWLHIARVGVGFLALPFRSAVAGWEDARRVAAIDFVAVASPLLAVPLLWKGYSLLAIPVVALLTTTLLYGGLSLWISRRVNLRPIFDFALWKTICKGGTAFFANEMVAQIYGFTTVYMLKRLTLDEGTVGVYSQAIRLQGTFLFVPVAIGTALLPSLARLADASATEFQNTQRRVTVIMIATSLPVAALVFLLAHPFCHLLYGSRALAEVPDVLQISALNMIPLYLSSVLYRFLVAQRKNGVWSLFLGLTFRQPQAQFQVSFSPCRRFCTSARA